MQRELIVNEPFYPRFHPTFVTDFYNHMTIHTKGKTHLVPYFGFGYWNAFPIWDNWAFGHLVSEDGVRWKMVEQIWKLPSINGTLYENKESGEVLGLLGWAGPDFDRFSLDRKLNVIRAEDDGLIKWSTHERSPLEPFEPKGWLGQDCDVFERNGEYFMAATAKNGQGDPKRRPEIQLYRSDNLLDWEHVGLFYRSDREGHATEALHIFPLDGKLVMTGCHRIDLDTGYLIGTMQDGKFVPDVPRGGPRERFRWNFESPVESRYARTLLDRCRRQGSSGRQSVALLQCLSDEIRHPRIDAARLERQQLLALAGGPVAARRDCRSVPARGIRGTAQAGVAPLDNRNPERRVGNPDGAGLARCRRQMEGEDESVALVLSKGDEELRILYEPPGRREDRPVEGADCLCAQSRLRAC